MSPTIVDRANLEINTLMSGRVVGRIGLWLQRLVARICRCHREFRRANVTIGEQTLCEVSARSETGYIRYENQDRMGRARVELGEVFAVADGMGGHKGGALAADLTVHEIERAFRTASSDLSAGEAIRHALHQANQVVYKQATRGDTETEWMGSTAIVLLISGSTAYVGHVGDSRAYLYRERELRLLTTDHTTVQRMVAVGMLTPEQARDHPEAGLLERAIGQKPAIEVDIAPGIELREGDGILLCSDGLSGYADDDAIKRVLRSKATVQELSDRLVHLVLDRGGHDNVTVQYIQYGRRKEEEYVGKGNVLSKS